MHIICFSSSLFTPHTLSSSSIPSLLISSFQPAFLPPCYLRLQHCSVFTVSFVGQPTITIAEFYPFLSPHYSCLLLFSSAHFLLCWLHCSSTMWLILSFSTLFLAVLRSFSACSSIFLNCFCCGWQLWFRRSGVAIDWFFCQLLKIPSWSSCAHFLSQAFSRIPQPI